MYFIPTIMPARKVGLYIPPIVPRISMTTKLIIYLNMFYTTYSADDFLARKVGCKL